jgi:multiple sugar transport system permease protein
LLAPYALLLLAFGLGPIGYAMWTSVHRYDVARNADVFNGLANWRAVLTDDRLLTSTLNVTEYLVVWLPSMLVLVLVVALLAHQRTGRFSAAVRLACYVPGAVAGSAAALMWLFMLTPGYSPFTPLLLALGLESSSETITQDSLPVVLSIIATAVTAGGWIVVLFAALNALPQDVLEAARIDGASALQVALRIKLPLVKNYLSLMLISSFAYGHPALRRAAGAEVGVHGPDQRDLRRQPARLLLRHPGGRLRPVRRPVADPHVRRRRRGAGGHLPDGLLCHRRRPGALT